MRLDGSSQKYRRLQVVIARASVLLLLDASCAGSSPAPRYDMQQPAAFASKRASNLTTTKFGEVSEQATLHDLETASPRTPSLPLRAGPRSVSGRYGVVTSVEAQATRAGTRILEAGGNAVDAATAVAYALAVTDPSAGNLGGGGFMLIKFVGQPSVAIDFRETAPAALTTSYYERLVWKRALGAASVGVPGTVAGLNLAHTRYGRLSRRAVLEPAIELARNGHRVSHREAATLRWSWPKLGKDAGARQAFSDATRRRPVPEGALLRLPELASTLELIAEHGDDGFYAGPVASELVRSVRAQGGVLSVEDLQSYRAISREPLHITYHGLGIDIMPPPSAGGVVVAQTLLMLQELGAARFAQNSVPALHLFIEASRRAQAERRFEIVDPDSLTPAELAKRRAEWTDPRYLLDKTPRIDANHATRSESVHPLFAHALRELPHTTHFAVADRDGNVVSCTVTLSASFGAKLLAPGTGVLLNNSVASFATAGANLAASGRRTISSMTPALVLAEDRVIAALGSPGGDTIPSTVVQVLRNLVDYGMSLEDAVEAPRIHHGFVPDVVRTEPGRRGLPVGSAKGLERMGHHLLPENLPIGDANSLVLSGELAFAYADSREAGLALAAHEPASPK